MKPVLLHEHIIFSLKEYNIASSEILRSAEGIALCRGLGCPQKFLFPTPPQAGVQRAQPFAGVWGVPRNSYFFTSPPQAVREIENAGKTLDASKMIMRQEFGAE